MDLDWQTHTLDCDGFAKRHLEQEWLVTNGTGAYAMGTVAACNTRRYHGLLVAADDPPVSRVVALNQIWDQLVIERHADEQHAIQTIDFTALMFRGADYGPDYIFSPTGCHMLQRFERGLSIRWTYFWGNVELERELFLHWKQQAITLRYRVRGLLSLNASAKLRLAPMMSLRDFHTLTRENMGSEAWNVEPENTAGDNSGDGSGGRGDTLTVTRDNLAVTCHLPGATFESQPHWWNNIYYPAERDRGQDDVEDHFVPGFFVIDIADDIDICFTAALGHESIPPQPDTADRARHLQPICHALLPRDKKPQTNNHKVFAIASDDFVVDRTIGREKLSTIIAGYPWFADWGRDTFIALPGLLLVTGRYDEAKQVLQAFAGCIRDGLVPNRFDDYQVSEQAAHYNTVDASLWFIHATFEYLRVTKDELSWKQFLRDAVVNIVEAYLAGTRANGHAGSQGALIEVDVDGLIVAGHAQSQLTWMDAACCDTIFTPRQGKTVEINALWFNALMQLAQHLPDTKANRYAQLARKVKRSFESTFWNEHCGGLFDHIYIDEHGRAQRDESIRPNQIFAVSLPHSPLSHEKQQQVLELVRESLLVPMGLRTLPPEDSHYHPRYSGDQCTRDEAYHQGTTWPWLIGPYAEAVLRVANFTPQAKLRSQRAIAPLLEQLSAVDDRPHSTGQLHEIFEADPQEHARPVGCIAQAWSIAQLLRMTQMIEDEPPHQALSDNEPRS